MICPQKEMSRFSFFQETTHSSYQLDETNKIVREAEQIVSGQYVFNNVWDMEPCEDVVKNKDFKWSVKFDDDPEWAYMFTRFDYSFKLIVAYEVTRDRSFIDHGLNFIKRWYHDNARFIFPGFGKLFNRFDKKNGFAHRTLDLAILASNIADYSLYCRDNHLIDESIYERNKRIATRICWYVFNSDREFKTLTNWGIIENGFVLYTVDALGIAFPTEKLLERLKHQISVQFLSDGSHSESSPMYLAEVLLPLLKCIRFCKTVDTKAFYDPTKKGCVYLRWISTPNCCIPNIGDSDSVNISDLMIIARNLFNDVQYLNAANRNLTIEYVYKYNMAPLTDELNNSNYWTDAEERFELKHQSIIKDKDFGLYIMCSNTPYGPSGHKHYDFLSFLVFINGKSILIDGGRETYKDGDIRRQSKSFISHNTIAIDGEKYWRTINAWSVFQRFSGQITKRLNDDSVLMSCVLGDNEVRITRVLSYIKGFGIAITDFLDQEGVQYQACFNFAPEAIVKPEQNSFTIQKDDIFLYYKGTAHKAYLESGRCSNHYNAGMANKRILCNSSKGKEITHFFLLKNVNITCKYDDKTLQYLCQDTNGIISSISLSDHNL